MLRSCEFDEERITAYDKLVQKSWEFQTFDIIFLSTGVFRQYFKDKVI